MDPEAPKDIPPRQSIEARAIAYFPDHKPNTCPDFPKEEAVEDPKDVNKNIAQGVQKLLSIAPTVNSWPSSSKEWVKSEFSKGKTGVKTIATSLANDSTGVFGLKNFSKRTKEKIVDELLKDDKFEQQLNEAIAKMK